MVTPGFRGYWADRIWMNVSRSARSIRHLSVNYVSISGGVALAILQNSVGGLPARCNVVTRSHTHRAVPENSPVLENVAPSPQPARSEPRPMPIDAPKIDAPKIIDVPKVDPTRIDPRVEQQVPARSRGQDLLRVVPSQSGSSGNDELGVLRRRQENVPKEFPSVNPSGINQPDEDSDLGEILIRPKPPAPPKPPRQSVPKSLYLTGRVDYFQNSNVLASPIPQSEGAVRSSLSLFYAPALGAKTFLLATTEASVLRYGTLSRLNSDELRLKVGIYHQWTPKISTELGWSYYQLSSAPAGLQQVFHGKRFFNEHSLRVDLIRQDALNPSLSLTTLYQFRWNLAGDVDSYDRVVNNAIASLSYKLSPRTQAALDYQYSWTHFTQQTRDDQAHFLGTRLSHSVNDRLQISVFGGRNFGTSSESRVNLAGWIFGVGLGFNVPIL